MISMLMTLTNASALGENPHDYTFPVLNDQRPRMQEKERRGIQSIEIGSQLLLALARHVAPMALKARTS